MWLQQLPNGTSLHDVILWLDGNGIPDRKTKTAYTETNITRGVKIHGGTAMAFDGADSKIDLGSKSLGAGDITVTAWINPTSDGEANSGAILDNGKFDLRFSSTQTDKLVVSSDSATYLAGAVSSITMASWQFVCVTRPASGDTSMYINGVVTGTPGSSGTPAAGANNETIGNNDADNMGWDGYITNIICFNKVLTADQIRQMYNKHK